MGAGDGHSQACSSCASYHWAYRDQWVMLVTIGSACVPDQDGGHGLVAVSGKKPGGCHPPLMKIAYTLKYIMERGEVEGG